MTKIVQLMTMGHSNNILLGLDDHGHVHLMQSNDHHEKYWVMFINPNPHDSDVPDSSEPGTELPYVHIPNRNLNRVLDGSLTCFLQPPVGEFKVGEFKVGDLANVRDYRGGRQSTIKIRITEIVKVELDQVREVDARYWGHEPVPGRWWGIKKTAKRVFVELWNERWGRELRTIPPIFVHHFELVQD